MGTPETRSRDVGLQRLCEAGRAVRPRRSPSRGGEAGRPPAPRGVRVWRSLEPEPQSGRLPGSFTVQAPPQVTLGLERRPRFCFLSLLGLPTRETGSMA